MRSENILNGRSGGSFIERARRAQIVACAIDAIAELGYANASLVEIARRAGVSKGVILYHFDGRRELVDEIVKTILGKAAEVMGTSITAEHSAGGRLRAYLKANLEFLGAHRNETRALLNIAAGARSDDGKPFFDFASVFDRAVSELEQLLRQGQERGEFREFSTREMAIAIRNTIDGLVSNFGADPKLDLASYVDQVVTIFELATQAVKTHAGER